jgi:hypothetical protein
MPEFHLVVTTDSETIELFADGETDQAFKTLSEAFSTRVATTPATPSQKTPVDGSKGIGE